MRAYGSSSRSRTFGNADWTIIAAVSYLPPLASDSHFFINEALAAPARALPFLPMAFDSQPDGAALAAVSASHFFMKEALAAPARALPFLSMAFDSQPDGAGEELSALERLLQQ